MDTGRCKDCGLVIYWVRASSTGRVMPIDPAPDERMGNVLVAPDGTTAYVFANHASLDHTRRIPGHACADGPAYTAHHFTCTARGGPGAAPPPPAPRAGEGEQGTLF